MERGELYVRENKIYELFLDMFNDEAEIDKFINSSLFTNRDDFKRGFIFGMSILSTKVGAMTTDKILVRSADKFNIAPFRVKQDYVKKSDNLDDFIDHLGKDCSIISITENTHDNGEILVVTYIKQVKEDIDDNGTGMGNS